MPVYMAATNSISAPVFDDNTNYSNQLFLHQIVVNNSELEYKSTDYMRAIECYLDESDNHELNEQDIHGRTALHVAVESENVDAIVGLLMVGSDVNVADYNGKTPFTYCLGKYDMSKYVSNQMFYTFLGHVYKLVHLGLYVSEENYECYKKARARHQFNDKRLQLEYDSELDKMEDVQIGNGMNLRKFLYHGPHAITTSTMKKNVVEDVITSRDFYDEFPKFCCIIKLQYRRGLMRRKVMQRAKMILIELTGFGLPDPCTETIIKHLGDIDLINLVKLFLID